MFQKREFMKSNEEFIAGIYEKAAVYKEEKERNIEKVSSINRPQLVAKMTKIAAMVAVCIGLAGVGTLVLGRDAGERTDKVPNPTLENYGISLSSEQGDGAEGAAQFRIIPVTETVTFTGVVTDIDVEEKRIWLKLSFEEAAPIDTEGSVVCIRWDMLEKITDEIVVGAELTAMGALSMYENADSEYDGCAELVLTDLDNLEIR